MQRLVRILESTRHINKVSFNHVDRRTFDQFRGYLKGAQFVEFEVAPHEDSSEEDVA